MFAYSVFARSKFVQFGAAVFFGLIVASPSAAESSLKSFDVERYLGVWHELARLPVFYQNGCKNSKAIYRRLNSKRFSVTNTCEKSGKIISTSGEATQPRKGRFAVEFKRIFTFRAEYKVAWVDDNYRMALVVVPNKNRAWFLSRTNKPNEQLLAEALKVFKQQGYSETKLIWN